MKNILTTSLSGLLALVIVSLCAVGTARAQSREERLLVARAGGVNLVSGGVTFKRSGETEWQRLSPTNDLKSGDTVRTGAEGRVEVLLNPGSYFRAGEGTEFELVDTSLDDLRLRLAGGSVLVEATGYGDTDLSIVIATPQTRVRVVRSGLYRINVLPSGVTEVAVQKGRALVGEGDGTLVKGGKVATVGAGGVEVAKLDKQSRDGLDQWSKERGKELAKLNEKLSRRNTSALLAQAGFNSLFSMQSRFGHSGVWLWNARGSCYTFLPFYADWRSPYGYWYGNWSYTPFGCGSCQPRVYNGPVYTGGVANNPSGGTPSGTPPSGNAPSPAPTDTRPTSPPVRDNPNWEPRFRRSPEIDQRPAGRRPRETMSDQ